jgi:DNA-binding winged helix-turn-helix (wHTH) protein/tetratricopeptide (TPR) repeat protein
MGTEFQVGEWFIYPDLNQISNDGRTLPIEPKAMDVLLCLAAHPGEVLAREQIRREVWQGTHVGEDALTYTISELRKALGDRAKDPQFIQTIPRRGYRLIAPVSRPADTPSGSEANHTEFPRDRIRWRTVLLGTAGFLAVVTVAFSLWHLRGSPALTTSDSVILTDFANSTGDPVFDDALRQALAIHLKQSPFLNIFPEEQARETLPYMGRSPQEPLTKEVCREICQRRGIRAMIAGSIASLGRNYVISLEAMNSRTGEVIARHQEEAGKKEDVLKALGKAATDIRQRLGESLASIERFDKPLEQATTSSLEAFKAYSQGRKRLVAGRWAEGVPHYLRALELDSDFASAYDDLAWCYANLWQPDLAADAARKAFSLRTKVSEYEKLSISAIYYTLATGEVLKAIEALEMMRTIYPRSAPVHNTLGGRYASVGRLDDAIQSYREAIRLSQHPNAFSGMASAYLRLNRLSDAKKTIAQARSCGVDNQDLRSLSFLIAFFEEDRATMDNQVQLARGSPDEFKMKGLQAAAAAFGGRLREARLFHRQAIEAAQRSGMTQAASELAAEDSWTEALFDTRPPALHQPKSPAPVKSWQVLLQDAMTLIVRGEAREAKPLVDQLEQSYSRLDHIRNSYLPTLRAVIELETGNRAKALESLRALDADRVQLPQALAYIRGKALLRHEAAKEAEAEFIRILKNKRIDTLSPLYPLAHLGMARAAYRSGDLEKSRKSYEDFFALWKSADPDLVILEEARAEYERLHQDQAGTSRTRSAAEPVGSSQE